jgi:hypothetical protein
VVAGWGVAAAGWSVVDGRGLGRWRGYCGSWPRRSGGTVGRAAWTGEGAGGRRLVGGGGDRSEYGEGFAFAFVDRRVGVAISCAGTAVGSGTGAAFTAAASLGAGGRGTLLISSAAVAVADGGDAGASAGRFTGDFVVSFEHGFHRGLGEVHVEGAADVLVTHGPVDDVGAVGGDLDRRFVAAGDDIACLFGQPVFGDGVTGVEFDGAAVALFGVGVETDVDGQALVDFGVEAGGGELFERAQPGHGGLLAAGGRVGRCGVRTVSVGLLLGLRSVAVIVGGGVGFSHFDAGGFGGLGCCERMEFGLELSELDGVGVESALLMEELLLLRAEGFSGVEQLGLLGVDCGLLLGGRFGMAVQRGHQLQFVRGQG